MKTRFVAVAVAATLGLGSVSAFARDNHRDHAARQAWQHQRAEPARGHWAQNNRYVAPRYYGPAYRDRRDDGDVVGALVLGALAGALVGQASNAYSYTPPPPAVYYPPPATYYNPGYGYYGY
ncbi:hypothetical protein [Ramlibacter alkalitolerans]|uniref:Transmembrane protein n=1 Tax=Ramlibacter alkalitolerans TaxID=2039631 RepID=A0ABS1JWE2_9BURK|nr:hypothetical protein [Ramlibacter alkalitolerans]MBL0428635.1 hypothetical protein [Ramlibacter alkalitolerans]